MGPKKPNRFVKIDVVKDYIYCQSYDELFQFGVDGMVQVEYIDYGLGWDKLKRGEQGDTACFEIVSFEVLCPEEQIRLEERFERAERKREAFIKRERARHKMRNRIKRIIMGNHFRKLYWLPSLVHGRLVLAFLSKLGKTSEMLIAMNPLKVRLGIYLVSLAVAYCLRESASR